LSAHCHDPQMIMNAWTWTVPLTVLATSFLGSAHCAGMCGGLAVNFAPHRSGRWAYQGGRLLSYAGIGALSGAAGQTAIAFINKYNLSLIAAILMAGFLIIMGWRSLRGAGVTSFHLRLPAPIARLSTRLWLWNRSRNPSGVTTPFLAGVLTLLLPCGFLYGFVAGAAATGRMWTGALFMTAFWLGTVPALGFGSAWLNRLLQPLKTRAPRLTGVLLIAAGGLTIAMRFI
jgi:sulfite exporter TauE/SafE